MLVNTLTNEPNCKVLPLLC